MNLAFLGLGRMGHAIAANLIKAADLVGQGARLARSPREAADGCELVLSMLADDAALRAVTEGEDGLLAGLAAGAVHVSMSTIAVATAKALAERHAAQGKGFVCAPVFGRPDAAAAGKLFVIAAGAPDARDKARPALESVGQKLFEIGDEPAQANLIKLCGNFAILAAVEAMGEAAALAQKGGVSKAALLEILTGTLFDAPVYRTYGAILAKDAYTPAGFAAPLGLKDMRLAAEAAEASRTPMPLLSLLRDRLLETIAKDGEDVDWSAIARTSARNAGL